MNDVRMTMDAWRHALRTAATIWDFDDFFADAGEPSATETWWAALRHFETQDVCEAFSRLALTLRFRPKLAEIVDATREAAQERRMHERRAVEDTILRLVSPSQRSVEGRLHAFDQAAQQWRLEQRAELQQVAHRHHLEDGEVRARALQIEEPGPFARRARELIAGNVVPGEGIEEMLRSFGDAAETSPRPGADGRGNPSSIRSA